MIDTSNCVLVAVDFQGKLAEIVHQSDKVLKNAEILLQGMKALGVPVIATEQYPKGLGHTVGRIAQWFDESPVIEKGSFSCCGETTFMDALKATNRKHVVLCGIETHVCVYQTAKDLIDAGYTVHIVTDAVSSRTKENKRLGIRKIESMGGIPTGTEMVLFELLKVSGTEQFKTISRLVR